MENAAVSLDIFFLVLRYAYVFLFLGWLLVLLRSPRPWLVAAGSLGFAWFAYFAIQFPLARPYALFPRTDRMFNVAMASTASTGHSPFESYQVGFGDHEPFWRLIMQILSFGRPENVLHIYLILTPAVLAVLAVSLYFGLRSGENDDSESGLLDKKWEVACIVYAVLLLNSSPHEKFGVFESFWSMTFLLKPNHTLGFVLLPWWVRSFTSERNTSFWVGLLLLATLSWMFLLHWSYVMLGLAVYPFLARRLGHRPNWRHSWVAGGLSSIAAIPYVLFLYRYFPADNTTVGRHVWDTSAYFEGYLNVFAVSYEHGPLFFLSVSGIGLMLYRRRRQDVALLSLLAGCVVGWLVFLIGFWMRRTIQPEEFYFYTRFLLSVAAGSGLFLVVRESSRIAAWLGGRIASIPQGLCLVLLVTLPFSFPYWWNPVSMDRYYSRSLSPIPTEVRRLTTWVRAYTDRNDVFLASPELANWITALSGRRVLLTGDHRPPNDYERRAELTRRVLTSDEPGPYREAHEDYLVTHLALDEDYSASFDTELSRIASLPWLKLVYQEGTLYVFAFMLD